MKVGEQYYRKTDITIALLEDYLELSDNKKPHPYKIIDHRKQDNGFQEVKMKYNHPGYTEAVIMSASGFERFFVKADNLAEISKIMTTHIEILHKNYDILLDYFMK